VLEIALTARKSVPMCGIPYHAASGYVSKLLKAGYKVAVCDQVEDAKQARGIVKEPHGESYRRAENDPVEGLRERMLLLTSPGYYGYYYVPWSVREYPDVALPPQVAAAVEPAASLAWKPSRPRQKAPESTSSRAAAQMMVDLEQMIGALKELGGWKVNKSGTLPMARRNRLGRLLPVPAGGPLEPPDRIALEYALLCGLGVVESDGDEGWLEPGRAGRLLHLPHEAQASEWVRAWLAVRLWQDGIGQVPDRDGAPYVDNPNTHWGFWSWDPPYDYTMSADQSTHHTRGYWFFLDYMLSLPKNRLREIVGEINALDDRKNAQTPGPTSDE
jgi:hypothetical protein